MALKKFLMIGVVAGLLVACGDEASDKSPVQVAEESSSSVDEVLSSSVNVEESSSSVESEGLSSSVENGASSSSEKSTESSSGKNTELAEVSSCSVAEGSSSSTTVEQSSSSVKAEQSSSSEKVVEPSSSSKVQESSSSVKVEESSSSAKTDASSSSEKPAESSSSEKVAESSSSEKPVESSSSSSVLQPCKTQTEDNCIYGTLFDDRDGKTYKTVKIGEQWWMAENLNYADSSKTASLMGKSWCYNNSIELCNKYGRLYTWAAAIDSVKLATDIDNPLDCGFDKNCTLPDTVYGICPPGWHLPSKDEWISLFNAVGGKSTAGYVLKSLSGWNNDENGIDGVGFCALPAGNRNPYGSFIYNGYRAIFWTALQHGEVDAYNMYLYYNNEYAGLYYDFKQHAYSVRCLKN